VIFGIGITLGWHFARFASGESFRVNVEFGVSGTAVSLTVLPTPSQGLSARTPITQRSTDQDRPALPPSPLGWTS
jgi:hypothetical protein